MSLTREAGVGGRVEVRFLVGGVLQRVSSGSEVCCRSVRSVKTDVDPPVTGEGTGDAVTFEAQGPTGAP